MPKEPPNVLPPIDPSLYVLEEFEWCQVLYLFARELTRAPKATRVEWNEALSEANEVVRVMKEAGAIMVPTPWLASPGYTDMVHWPSMVCAANAYASMEPGQRQYIRQRISEGMTPMAILTMGAGGCDYKVLTDEEYIPAPPCIPSDAAKLGWIAVGTFVGVFALMTVGGWIWGNKRR